MPKKLEDKGAVITGGTEEIGLATAKLFVREGACVFITGRRQQQLDAAVEAIGTNLSGIVKRFHALSRQSSIKSRSYI